MEDFIIKEAKHFAKLTHANTRDYEKLINLKNRFDIELQPYSSIINRLKYINEYEKEVIALFQKHLSVCTKPETCPQNKTHSNAIFLVGQERNNLQGKLENQSEGTFKKGQFFDAYKIIIDIIEKATQSIKLIDNYISHETLNFFTHKKDQKVEIKILTKSTSLTDRLTPFVEKFNKQYGSLEIKPTEVFHDRFLVIDDSVVYMIGASIKDIGNKMFMLNKVEGERYKQIILQEFNNEWSKA
ncbi:MAG TPA: hypothetical protein VK483_15840 [Chitinophagaceae bacterium]|nr:hypothetical protein [Chitinophagaceae bacterium]